MTERYGIEWAPVALDDLDAILKYIAARDCVDAAVDVYGKIMHRIEGLVLHPTRCRVPPELEEAGVTEFRELILAPYSVFFRIRGRTVGIVAVLDRRRDLQELLVQRVLRT